MSGAVAIFGAGAGGAAAAVDLALRGFEVRLWNGRPGALEAFADGIEHEGVLGDGVVKPAYAGVDAEAALEGAGAVLVCLPALGHAGVAAALAKAGVSVPVILNPGHTGGALHFRAVFAEAGGPLPPLAELSTLTYVARRFRAERVTIGDRARTVRVACLPGGEAALAAACELYPDLAEERDVLATDLANPNLVLHPPGAITGAAWVEATGGDFLFYVDGMTPGVVRVIEALDAERRAVAAAFGHALPPLREEMAAIGTAVPADDTGVAIRGGVANSTLRAPDGLDHRYYREDLAYGIVPFLALAEVARIDCPTAAALLQLGETLLGERLRDGGLDARRLGIEGLDADGVLDLVARRTRA